MKELIKRKSEKECISCRNSSKGITLLALVITIIIIIILSTVAISFLFGENGLITKAQQAKLEQEIATARETLTMVLGDAFVEKKINPEYNQDEFLDEFIKAREPNVYLEDVAIGLDGHVFGLDRSVPELGEYQGELTGPRIKEIKVTNETTNSASIEVIALNTEGATYEYWYKANTEGEGQWKKIETDNKSNTCTINGLTQGEIYNIRVVVTTNDGNATRETNVYLGEIPEGTITFTPPEWVGDGTARTTINTSEKGYTLQYQIALGDAEPVDTAWQIATSGQTIEELHHNETVYGRLWDGINESKEYGSIAIKDEESPIVNVTSGGITTNSITVNAAVTDGQSGMKEDTSYTYSIKQSGQGEESYTTPSGANNLTTNTYIFTGLTQGTSYDVKVEVNGDIAGNIGIGTATNLSTGTVGGAEEGLIQGNIIASSPTWSGGKASITLTTNTGMQIQYQKNTTSGQWTTITSGNQVIGLNHNDTVFARLWDGINYGQEASVTIRDTNKPSAVIVPNITSTETGKTILAQVTHTDGESGVDATRCKWIYNQIAGNIGLEETTYTGGTFNQNPQTITLSANTEGVYYLHVLTIDNAGNKKETISSAITVEEPAIGNGKFSEEKGVNTPDLADGKLTPIKWNGSSWVTTTADDSSWYNYSTSSKQWANAITSDGSMWVWIPRFAYQISSGYHSNSAGTINIKFMQGTSNIAADGYTAWNNESGQGNWNIHPAFNYNGIKAGIWVAKFEASQNGNVLQVKSGVSSWRNISINNIFSICQSYDTSLNSHMMKNSEWGAVAYLAQSSYGKNAEITTNTSSSYYTGGGTGESYTSNIAQSTTGNIWGIYDMSGGAQEYVAAYVNNGSTSLNDSGLLNIPSYMKDVYISNNDTQSGNYDASVSNYGDAIYETSSNSNSNYSWYRDFSLFPYSSSPFFIRGGYYGDNSGAGIYYFSYANGFEGNGFGFRPVLVINT